MHPRPVGRGRYAGNAGFQRIPYPWISASFLRSVIACEVGVLVFLFGAYIVLRVCGLTQLALTVVGGTGLIGLAVGLAFRHITENFLWLVSSSACSGHSRRAT